MVYLIGIYLVTCALLNSFEIPAPVMPHARQALRHRAANSTDLTSSQSSHERAIAVGQRGHDIRRHSRLQLTQSPASKGILFYTPHLRAPHLRAELRYRSLSCVFCRNMNSNVVGGTGSIRTNVRVIAATNRDLQAVIAASMFRSDLF